jgi:viroplasmin and RNaseH domain-containing protein
MEFVFDTRDPYNGNYKYFVVKVGRKPGIYYNWKNCLNQIQGVPEAEYQGFDDLRRAEYYFDPCAFQIKGQTFLEDYFPKKDVSWREIVKKS